MLDAASTLPKGAWVLVTGAAGYVGSHVVTQFLQRGYRVRGTTRSINNSSWLLDHELLREYTSSGALELVEVSDMTSEHAFDEALKGICAVVHVAAINSLDPDPSKVVGPSVAALLSLLRAAALERSVERFVFTASSFDAAFPAPNIDLEIARDTWNDLVVQMSNAPPPYDDTRGLMTYFAGKVEAHKALWRFVEDQKPNFVVNSVGFYMAAGQILHESQLERVKSLQLFEMLYNGETSFTAQSPSIYYTHVRDVAVMHVAAALDPEVKGQRIHGWAEAINWNGVLRIMRRLDTHKSIPADIAGADDLRIRYRLGDDIAPKLVEKWSGQTWTSLEVGVKEMVDFFDVEN